MVDAIMKKGGIAFITADHGNADKMLEEDGTPFTAHTTNPVPFIVVGKDCKLREGGVLADIAPTMLEAMELPQPGRNDRQEPVRISTRFHLRNIQKRLYFRVQALFTISNKTGTHFVKTRRVPFDLCTSILQNQKSISVS